MNQVVERTQFKNGIDRTVIPFQFACIAHTATFNVAVGFIASSLSLCHQTIDGINQMNFVTEIGEPKGVYPRATSNIQDSR